MSGRMRAGAQHQRTLLNEGWEFARALPASDIEWSPARVPGTVAGALSDAGRPARIVHLAVRGLPGSGTPAELMEAAGISADQVVQAARELLGT